MNIDLNLFLSSFPNPLKAVIFDLGGVIVDLQNRKAERSLQEFFHTRSAFFGTSLHEQVLKGDLSNDQFWKELCVRYSMEPSAQNHDHFFSLWNSAIQGLNLSMVEFIEQLNLDHPTIKRYILSNADFWHWQYLSSQFPSQITFDAIFLSCELKLLKPDPRIFSRVLEIIDLSAQDCLFIDDSMQNILAAQGLGFKTFHYQGGK